MRDTASSEGLLELHSSDELTGGFLTTWGELESEGKTRELKQEMRRTLMNLILQLYALGVPESLAVLFFRR